MHLDIFSLLEAANLFLVEFVSKDKLSGNFCVWQSCTSCWWGKSIDPKMAKAKRCTIIILNVRLNGMVAQADLTRSLIFRMKRSISGTCSFLDAQFSFMPREVMSLRSGLNLKSLCMCVIMKPRCRYNLCTCVIPSAMCSTFRFLIILLVANMMCREMMLRKLILLMCMRSQKMVTHLYLSRMVLGALVILTGSTCCTLRRTVLSFRCGMLGP